MTGCGRKLGPYDCCTVVCGDCLELMKALPDGCVDAVITDPPYGITQECDLTACGIKRYGRVFFGDWDGTFPLAILESLSSLNAGTYYIFCPYQVLGELSAWAKRNELQQRVLWWKKTNPARRNGDVYWSIPGEHCFFAKRSGAIFNAKYEVGFFEHSVVHRRNHPTEKPLDLITVLVSASTVEGQTIFDPFLGSGTTAVAAKKLGRHFLGFEINPDYCQIAEERIALVEAQPNLFEKKPLQMGLEVPDVQRS